MTNIFEQASRKALRFQTVKGELTVEQLWQLNLDKGEVNLYQLATELIADVNSKPQKELSFFKKKTNKNELAELKFAIIEHIVITKVSEIEENESAAVRKSEIDEIDRLISQKEAESKSSMSLEELKKLKAKLSK